MRCPSNLVPALAFLACTSIASAQQSGWTGVGYDDVGTGPWDWTADEPVQSDSPYPAWNDGVPPGALENDRWFDSDFGWELVHPRAPSFDPASDGQERRAPATWGRPERRTHRIHNVRGTLAGYDLVRPADADVPTSWLRLRFRDGVVRLVDVGPRVSPHELDLQRGQRVSVRGFDTVVAGHEILQATRLRIDGRSLVTGAHRPSAERVPGAETVRGRVVSIRSRGSSSPKVEIRNAVGSTRWVEVGRDLGGGQLHTGDRVEIRGQRQNRPDRSILVATDLERIGDASRR